MFLIILEMSIHCTDIRTVNKKLPPAVNTEWLNTSVTRNNKFTVP